MIRFLKWLFGFDFGSKTKTISPTNTPVTMDEGDYHSGPHGYSPNTAYPETQYGSGFDEDAEWNEDES